MTTTSEGPATDPGLDESAAFDLIVVGAGAAGLATAVTGRLIGLDVLLIEASEFVGGTAARSGGVVWIPNNPLKQADPADNEADVLSYVAREAGDCFVAEDVRSFVRTAPEMVRFLTEHADLKFIGPDVWPDYHQDFPGARAGGRSMRADDFDGRLLGTAFLMVRPPLRSMTLWGGMMVGAADFVHLLQAKHSVRSLFHVARIAARHGIDRLAHARGTRLTGGNALVARLLHTYLRLGGTLRVATRLKSLELNGNRVGRVHVEHNGHLLSLHSTHGVVLATGGMPANAMLRASELFAVGDLARSQTLAPIENRGEGLQAAIAVGGAVRREVIDAAAWVPVSRVQWPDGEVGWFPHFFDRSKPGFVMVDVAGKRFVNEATSYHDIGRVMLEQSAGGPCRAFIVCDHRALTRYGVGVVAPLRSSIRRWQKCGYLFAAPTLQTLAEKMNVDPTTLVESVARYNADAKFGRDPEFGKGTSAYDRYIGDAQASLNACVAPLTNAPFYAVAVQLGDLGTFQGLRADASSRVIGRDGHPIEGLHVAGNDRASLFGGTYPAAGITLGPALAFGYLAALSAAGMDGAEASKRARGKLATTSVRLRDR